jgi:hypothetical protein
LNLGNRHPRDVEFQKIAAEFGLLIENFFAQHQVTPSEAFYLMSKEMSLLAADCVRYDREEEMGEAMDNGNPTT